MKENGTLSSPRMLERNYLLTSVAFLFLFKLGCTPVQPAHLQVRPEVKPAASASVPSTSTASVVELDVFPPLQPERPRGPAPKVVSIGVGWDGTCAVDDQGGLYCWGLVPDGKKDVYRAFRPVRVAGIDDAVAVRSAWISTGFCVLRRSHPMTCWDLSGGRMPNRGELKEMPQLHPAGPQDLWVGSGEVCAVGADRKFTCVNEAGKERGMQFASSQVLSIAQGPMGTAAITPQGIRCYGHPGWLCNPLSLLETDPKQGLQGIRQVSIDAGLACALGAKEVRCWGKAVEESAGEDGPYTLYAVPAFRGAVQLAIEGDEVIDGRFADGRVERFRFQGKGQGTSQTVLQRGARDVQASMHQGCALLQDGGVRCWGQSGGGKLGDNTLSFVPEPRPIDGIADARRVWMSRGTVVLRSEGTVLHHGLSGFLETVRGQVLSRGAASDQVELCPSENLEEQQVRRGPEGTVRCSIPGLESAVEMVSVVHPNTGESVLVCGRLPDGTVRCKGMALLEKKGEEPREIHFEPDKVLMRDAVALQLGAPGVCAIQRDGLARCPVVWRSSNLGVERGSSIQLPSKSAIRRIAVSSRFACALDAAGAVYCDDKEGTSVHRVQGLPPVKDLVGGFDFSCALTQSGHVFCWGDNKWGQLGVGDAEAHTHPVQARGLTHVVQIAAEDSTACARTQSGQVFCWGLNVSGETGQPMPNPDAPAVEPMW